MGYFLSGSAGKNRLFLVGIVISLLSYTGDCRVLSIRDFGGKLIPVRAKLAANQLSI